MRLILTGFILLILSGCYALNREQYDAIVGLENNYNALENRDRELSGKLDAVAKRQHANHAQGQ